MDLAWISVAALALTVLVSCTTRMNPGVLAIALAWNIALWIAPLLGLPLGIKLVLAGFPSELFLTLTGVTLLFAQAQVNGTLTRVAHVAVGCCRGQAGFIPFVFFGLAATLSAIGAGSVATAALMAPMAMAAAANARIPAFLMAIMVGHGAVAGGMSPFAVTGIIANGLMDRMNLPGHHWQTFFHNFAANALVAVTGYLAFGGWRLIWRKPEADAFGQNSLATELRSSRREEAHSFRAGSRRPKAELSESLLTSAATHQEDDAHENTSEDTHAKSESSARFRRAHWVTLAVIALLIIGVLVFKVHVGMAAFAAAALLTMLGLADEKETFRAVPWPVILMVCGVTVLTSLLERTGGIDRVTGVIASVSSQRSLPGVMAFATGVISVYSSTSGVVLPALLPAVPGLLEKIGGGDPLALASSINIGGNLVDVSPLSTIGALCIACAAASEDRRVLFNKVLAWGLSMSVVAAVLCILLFGLR